MKKVSSKAGVCKGVIDHSASEFKEYAQQVARRFYEMLVESKKLMEEGNDR